MSHYEFKVVPAPLRPRKLTGLDKGDDLFCATLTDVMTDMGLDGWEFVGAETLPCEIKVTPFSFRREDKSCLVFRRVIERLDKTPAAPVQPKRVARSHVVARVRDGARRIALATPPEGGQGVAQRPSRITLPQAEMADEATSKVS